MLELLWRNIGTNDFLENPKVSNSGTYFLNMTSKIIAMKDLLWQ